MKKLLLLSLLMSSVVFSQNNDARISKSIETKVMMMQQFVHKAEKGEEAFWQTKGKVTYQIVNYSEAQNPKFKQLFIDQYRELLPIYNTMIVSENEKDTNLFIKTLIRQEDDYRKMLTPDQLVKYREKLSAFEKNDEKNRDAYNSLFFSDWLLAEYKKRF
ncbi:hypothetical protein [Flavobacterium selenitireducens]|uniref:hypothetical protein n=1 Tax=Flavobacterium selenitireducens TaxID=2722704 RepID=UPI00168B11CA|nr:hypothetical protein [Flavobacterium selenitireducens]MBD3581380.1 hypothetical protein [Flavobacterium selenitireducens]